MIVFNRFRVEPGDVDGFLTDAQAAIVVLEQRDGFVSADLGRNVDDPDLFTVTTRWQNVGSYRRALTGYESRVVVVPLLSRAVDEPSAYDDVDLLDRRGYPGPRPTLTGQPTAPSPGRR